LEDAKGDGPKTDESVPVKDEPAPTTVPVPATKTSYTSAEVARHNNKASCWTVVRGKVYDATGFLSQHKGGAGNILKLCGKDGSAFFVDRHGGKQNQEATLDSLYIGELA